MKLSAGDIFDGKYEIIRVLGAGGFGLVYQAKDNELNRIVAIKIYSPFSALVDSKEQIIRFKREAQVLSKISHVNVVKIFRYGLLEEDIPFLVLEFIEGESLDKILARERTLSWRQSTKIILEVCKGLGAIHELGILHRDLKPQNIIVAGNLHNPLVKIIDFGLCKFQNSEFKSSNTLTNTGFVVGTVQYLSPEQCASKKTDERSDIYSLGIILYEMLVGEIPFSGQAFEQVFKHINTPMPRLSESVRGIKFPKQLEEIILKSCAKLPNSRYKSVDDLAESLNSISSEDGDLRYNPDLANVNSDKLNRISLNYFAKAIFNKYMVVAIVSLLLIVSTYLFLSPVYLFSFLAKNLISTNTKTDLQKQVSAEFKLLNYLSDENVAAVLDSLFSSFEFQSKTTFEKFQIQYYLFKEFCKNQTKFDQTKFVLALSILDYFLKIENSDRVLDYGVNDKEEKEALLDITNYLCSLTNKPDSIWRTLYSTLNRSRIIAYYRPNEIVVSANRLLIACLDHLPKLYKEDPDAYVNACFFIIRIHTDDSTVRLRKKPVKCLDREGVEHYFNLALSKLKDCQHKKTLELELHIFYGWYLTLVKKSPAEALSEYKKAKDLAIKIGAISEFQRGFLHDLGKNLGQVDNSM